MELEWRGAVGDDVSAYGGWCQGFFIAQVLRNGPHGWRAYIAHEPVDGVDYPTAEEAKAVAEAAVADRPDPERKAPPERRRPVPNSRPEPAPHPGRYRQPPR